MINANRLENPEKRMLHIKKILHDLPDHNFETFQYIANHLKRIATKGDLNKVWGKTEGILHHCQTSYAMTSSLPVDH